MYKRQGPLRRRLEVALKAAPGDHRDAGTVELARHYADAIDHSQLLWAAAVQIAHVYQEEGDPDGRRHTEKLAQALSARQVLAELGPKYLAALAALNLTTASRQAANGGARDESDPAEQALASLGQAARNRDAAAVDAAATPPDA